MKKRRRENDFKLNTSLFLSVSLVKRTLLGIKKLQRLFLLIKNIKNWFYKNNKNPKQPFGCISIEYIHYSVSKFLEH